MLAKAKLNTMEFLISKTLIYSDVNHDEFVVVNDVLKEYKDMKETIKNFDQKF